MMWVTVMMCVIYGLGTSAFPKQAGTMSRQLWSAGIRMMLNGEIPLTLYNSSRSKLRVAVAEVPGPMVKGIFSFVTETHSDDGLPHTLEHLVFMGSKKYPVKGILDVIANRCLASGTNAWTSQDHTAYTLTTVGSEGFLKVLPVYMDHVMSPTLTNEQFITEVHHINGEGQDAGVVYSEMQNYESDMEEMVSRQRKEIFYPEGNPYRVETGGRLGALRTTCNNDAVRKYHSEFYHLNNMMIVVCGTIDHHRLLDIISPLEEEVLSKNHVDFAQPFVEEIRKIEGPHETVIECPSDDVDFGIVQLSWVGPPAKDIYTIRALEVLFEYMQSTAVAPLQKVFIQLGSPYACSACFSLNEQTTSEIILSFCGVPVEKLHEIKQRFFDHVVANHLTPEGFDMERLGFIVDQSIHRAYSEMETCGHEKVFNLMISHQIYGLENGDLVKRLDEVGDLKRLYQEPGSFWANLVKEYFSNNYVCVVGKPSEEKVDEYAKLEDDRIEEQRKKFGPKGLAERDELLKRAIEQNSAHKASAEILNSFMVNNLEEFSTFKLNLFKSSENSSLEKLPFLKHLDVQGYIYSLPTKFVNVRLIWDTSKIPVEQRLWMMLWFELMFESPAKLGDKVVTYEEVTKLFTRDLLSQSISVGVTSSFEQYVTMELKVPQEKLEMLSKWANIFLKGIIFDTERVLVAAQKLVAEAIEGKRDGFTMCSLLHKKAIYDPQSNSYIHGTVQLEKFHNDVVEKTKNGSTWVLDQLEILRSSILASPLTLHMSCNEKVLGSAYYSDGWSFLTGSVKLPEKEYFKSAEEVPFRKDRAGNHLIATVGSSESSFLYQSIVFDYKWDSETLMAVRLLSQYLTQTEGPLYREVRGKGLAYGANIHVRPDKKMLLLSIYRSADLVGAYEQSKKIVLDTVKKGDFDLNEFEAAKRSLVCELIEEEDTVNSSVKQAILAQFRGVGLDYTKQISAKIWNATVEDVLKLGAKHLEELFDEAKCSRAIVVNPAKMKEVKKRFHNIQATPVESFAVHFHQPN